MGFPARILLPRHRSLGVPEYVDVKFATGNSSLLLYIYIYIYIYVCVSHYIASHNKSTWRDFHALTRVSR
jgi:hypothetical protein